MLTPLPVGFSFSPSIQPTDPQGMFRAVVQLRRFGVLVDFARDTARGLGSARQALIALEGRLMAIHFPDRPSTIEAAPLDGDPSDCDDAPIVGARRRARLGDYTAPDTTGNCDGADTEPAGYDAAGVVMSLGELFGSPGLDLEPADSNGIDDDLQPVPYAGGLSSCEEGIEEWGPRYALLRRDDGRRLGEIVCGSTAALIARAIERDGVRIRIARVGD